MKKSILAGAITIALSSAANAAVTSVNITSVISPALSLLPYAATGTLHSTAPFGSMTSVDPFLGMHWTAFPISFFDTTGVTQSYAGSSLQGTYNYQFTLSAGQIAWGNKFSWNGNNDIPVLNIMDCGPNPLIGDTCTGINSMPNQTHPFLNEVFTLANGNIASVSAVPIPAAAWLMGSGLIGLVGVARRHKAA